MAFLLTISFLKGYQGNILIFQLFLIWQKRIEIMFIYILWYSPELMEKKIIFIVLSLKLLYRKFPINQGVAADTCSTFGISRNTSKGHTTWNEPVFNI